MQFGFRMIGVGLVTAVMATLCGSASLVWAQADTGRTSVSSRAHQLQVPVGQESLRIEVDQPDRVRVNQTFEMQVRVSNTSENIVFRNVKVGHKSGQGLTIESSQLEQSQSHKDHQQPSHQTAQSKSDGEQRTARREDEPSGKASDGSNSQQEGENSNSAQEDSKQQQKKSVQEQEVSQQKQQGTPQDRAAQQEQQKTSRKSDGGGENSGSSNAAASSAGFDKSWTIDELQPGESRMIHISASSQQEGSIDSCLALVSYTPSLCVQTEFVKPDLEIVKQGPDRVNICEPIEFSYFVKNAGSGALEKFTIKDELGEGLQTTDGQQRLNFEVEGGLEPGEVRKFVAQIRATRAGEFSSRAIATSPMGEETRSSAVSTQVVEPKLAVQVDGPDAVYLDRPATYTVRLTNHGEGRSPQTRLSLRYPNMLSVANAGDPRETDRAVEQKSRSSERQQDQGQNQQNQDQQSQDQQSQDEQQSNNQDRQQQNQNQSGQNQQTRSSGGHNQAQDSSQRRQQDREFATLDWDLGELPPGESRLVRVTFNPGESGDATLYGEAVALCAEGGDRQSLSSDQSQAQTEVISLPALMLVVVDESDPVPVNDEVTYRVIVRNEGTAADQNVRVAVELPEALSFVEASGKTQAKSDGGGQVTFEPIESLEPGGNATWDVRAKVKSEGNVAVRATLESDFLSRTVRTEEPTTFFAGANRSSNQGSGRQDQQESSKQQE